ncbi:ABC transporter substrate-binding protein [Paracoccus sp. S-4012]|uniref:ABC transporter substrate-binding protein n=1 Tax=Paracoccus sp. S-4012 TaxID=2665648 RepID=UPI0012AFA5DC|nr:ABC transporter substrate-binding protein [Paracoccus sp. S-4012]MRX49187.1 ABC transporter substrate-binding protein [Paracoccus sp. S-4012]
MTIRRTLMSAAATALALGAGAASAEEIVLGATAPLTGPAANSGEAHRQGMELAVKEWNEGRGDYVNEGGEHPTFRLVIEDQNSKPEVAVSAVQRMVTRDGIKLLLGDTLHSHVTMALMELSPQFNLPILSIEPVSTLIADKVVSDPEKYAMYWKGNYNSEGYGNAVDQFVEWATGKGLLDPGEKKLAFVIEDTDYGHANADTIIDLLGADGWTHATTETLPAGSTDFYPVLTKLRAEDPDLTVSVFTAVNSGVALVRQMQEQAIPGRHLAIYYPTKTEFVEQVGDAAEGLVWASLQYAPELSEAHKAFDDKIVAEYGNPSTYSQAQAYCITMLGMRAIEQAGADDPKAISDAIGASDYECLTGRLVFNPENHTVIDGEGYIPIPVAQIQDGHNQIIWPESSASAEMVQ